jgi:hypothetical protein
MQEDDDGEDHDAVQQGHARVEHGIAGGRTDDDDDDELEGADLAHAALADETREDEGVEIHHRGPESDLQQVKGTRLFAKEQAMPVERLSVGHDKLSSVVHQSRQGGIGAGERRSDALPSSSAASRRARRGTSAQMDAVRKDGRRGSPTSGATGEHGGPVPSSICGSKPSTGIRNNDTLDVMEEIS